MAAWFVKAASWQSSHLPLSHIVWLIGGWGGQIGWDGRREVFDGFHRWVLHRGKSGVLHTLYSKYPQRLRDEFWGMFLRLVDRCYHTTSWRHKTRIGICQTLLTKVDKRQRQSPLVWWDWPCEIYSICVISCSPHATIYIVLLFSLARLILSQRKMQHLCKIFNVNVTIFLTNVWIFT